MAVTTTSIWGCLAGRRTASRLARIVAIGAGAAATVALAGCGSSSLPSLSSLTTGSISAPAAAPPPPKPITAADRALHVATTSARALKCGYNFDPARLRETYLASEAQRAVEDAAKAKEAYDFTHARIVGAIAAAQDYCTTQVTEAVKADLTRALAGDFEPSRAALKRDADAVLAGYQKNYGKTEFNPEWLRGDSTAPQTRPVQDE